MKDIERVIEKTCARLGLEREDVMSGKQSLGLWLGRYMIWHYLHYGMGLSSGRIGAYFSRDRRSIFRGIRLIKHQMRFDGGLREDYYRLCREIEGADD